MLGPVTSTKAGIGASLTLSAITLGMVVFGDAAGKVGGDAAFKYDGTTDTLTVGTGAGTIAIDDGGTIWTTGAQSLALGAIGATKVLVGNAAFGPQVDNVYDLGASTVGFKDTFMTGEVTQDEEADPSAPGANIGSLYVKDIDSRSYHVAKYPTGNVQIISGEPASVQTVDATVTTCLTVAVPTNSVLYMQVAATGYQSAGTNAAAYYQGAAYKNVAGVVTLIGAVSTMNTLESNAAWDFAPSISGTNILWRLTGVAATTIDWDCVLVDQLVSP